MSRSSIRLIGIIFLGYLAFSQLMFARYDEEFGKILKINGDLMQACSAASEGLDMGKEYLK